jgi:hypothetical protein
MLCRTIWRRKGSHACISRGQDKSEDADRMVPMFEIMIDVMHECASGESTTQFGHVSCLVRAKTCWGKCCSLVELRVPRGSAVLSLSLNLTI